MAGFPLAAKSESSSDKEYEKGDFIADLGNFEEVWGDFERDRGDYQCNWSKFAQIRVRLTNPNELLSSNLCRLFKTRQIIYTFAKR